MQHECNNLDAFLADELSAEAALRFAQHLTSCVECNDATRQQAWIDGLLCSGASASLEPAPAALYESLRTTIVRRRYNARFIACGLAAIAAAVIVAAGWTITQSRQADGVAAESGRDIASQTDAIQTDIHAAVVNGAHRPRATFVSSSDAIAVPLESADDDVTVVQLYPTTQTERRWQRELALQFTHSEPNGG